MITEAPFPRLCRFTCLLHHIARPETENRAPAAAPGCPWDPADMPLSCDSTSDVSTTLMWLKGHCSPEWDPIWTLESQQSKHVCLPAPVSINVSLDCLLFVGQTRALRRGTKTRRQTLRQVVWLGTWFSSDQVKKMCSAMSCYWNQNQVGSLARQPHPSEEMVHRMNQGRSHLLLGDLADKNPDWFIFTIQTEDILPKYKPGEAPGILAKLFQIYVRIMLFKSVAGTVGITL